MNGDMNKPRFSVLTYIIGNYEIVHEIEEITPDVEYVLVTDNPSIKSSTWNVVYVKNEHPEDNFDLCYKIRFNPFDYVHSDIVISIDGSMVVAGNLDKLVEEFNRKNYDIMLEIHPTRSTMYHEYLAWCQMRNYPVEQANKCLNYMAGMEGYDVKGYRGLYQYNFMIQRKNKINLDLNRMTLATIKYLAPEGKQIDRLDQTIGSFVINKYFNNIKVLPVSQRVCTSGVYFKWCQHGSDKVMQDNYNYDTPYLFNEVIQTIWVGE